MGLVSAIVQLAETTWGIALSMMVKAHTLDTIVAYDSSFIVCKKLWRTIPAHDFLRIIAVCTGECYEWMVYRTKHPYATILRAFNVLFLVFALRTCVLFHQNFVHINISLINANKFYHLTSLKISLNGPKHSYHCIWTDVYILLRPLGWHFSWEGWSSSNSKKKYLKLKDSEGSIKPSTTRSWSFRVRSTGFS